MRPAPACARRACRAERARLRGVALQHAHERGYGCAPVEAADEARESTYPKLDSGPDADYAAAYAASSLLLAMSRNSMAPRQLALEVL